METERIGDLEDISVIACTDESTFLPACSNSSCRHIMTLQRQLQSFYFVRQDP